MPLHLIATIGADGTAGRTGELPWFSPTATQIRRQFTDQSPLIIGRRAVEETELFDHRHQVAPPTIVLSEDTQYQAPPGFEHCQQIRRCIARLVPTLNPNPHIYVTGGPTTLERGINWCRSVTYIRLPDTYDGTEGPSLSTDTWDQQTVPHADDCRIEQYTRVGVSIPAPERDEV